PRRASPPAARAPGGRRPSDVLLTAAGCRPAAVGSSSTPEPPKNRAFGQFIHFCVHPPLSGRVRDGELAPARVVQAERVRTDHATEEVHRSPTMRILMVLTSHDQLGDTCRKTGFWLEEFAAPYFTFLDAEPAAATDPTGM